MIRVGEFEELYIGKLKWEVWPLIETNTWLLQMQDTARMLSLDITISSVSI